MVRDRTRTTNQMQGFLLDYGISLPVGKTAVTRLPAVLAMHELPPRLVAVLERLHEHFRYLAHRSVRSTRSWRASSLTMMSASVC